MIQLIKTRPLTDGTGYFGHIIVNGQSINDAMVQAGHATKRPSMDKANQQANPRQSNQPSFGPGAPGTPPLLGAGDGISPLMSKAVPQPLFEMASMQPGPAMMGNAMFGQRDRNTRSPASDNTGGNRQIKQMSQG